MNTGDSSSSTLPKIMSLESIRKLFISCLSVSTVDLNLNKYDADISLKAYQFINEYELQANLRKWTPQDMYKYLVAYLTSAASEWYAVHVERNVNKPKY